MSKPNKHFEGATPKRLAKALLRPDEAEKLRLRRRSRTNPKKQKGRTRD